MTLDNLDIDNAHESKELELSLGDSRPIAGGRGQIGSMLLCTKS